MKRNRRKTRDSRALEGALPILAAAGTAGALIGGGSALYDGGADLLLANIRPAAVAVGAARLREPAAGDYWNGCNDARAAGTAPIYRGEPGYRAGMDGDGDGIACEAHR